MKITAETLNWLVLYPLILVVLVVAYISRDRFDELETFWKKYKVILLPVLILIEILILLFVR